MSGASIQTFGCRLNLLESERIHALTRHVDDLVVINTCAVTASAERQARQAIRRAHRENPAAKIVVTGCAVQISPETWERVPGVHHVLGNVEKLKEESWQSTALAGGRAVSDIMASPPPIAVPASESVGHTRALLQVQQGCNHRCTFCVIPYGRGQSRSVPVTEVVARARSLVEAGHREVVLTGVDIASWGRDLLDRPALGWLCREVLRQVPALPRLRLSSLDPAAIDADFWALLADEHRFLPHVHLSLQAASDGVLKRMKRRHRVRDVVDLIDRARALRPGLAIGADLIAGFPTETDQQAQETLDFVSAYALPYLHVFPYSERPGTPAARMPSVLPETRHARAAALRRVGNANRSAYLTTMVGDVHEVLMEGPSNGHTRHFAPVRLRGETAERGKILTLRACGLDGDHLLAEIP